MPTLQLKATARKARVLHGHPWAYAGEIASAPEGLANGDAATLLDARGRELGSGVYNGASKIVWRRFSRTAGQDFDEAYLRGALEDAVERRPEETCGRIVWSDADFMPGLVVDRFGEVLVVQALTAAVDARLARMERVLRERFEPSEIVFRNDAPSRRLEGLPLWSGTASGTALAPDWFEIDGLAYWLDLASGQKTGFYLDQREQHVLVGGLAEGRRVLDGFCNQAPFGLQAALAGAEEVVAVDSSAECLENARRNAERNGLRLATEEANMFDTMRALEPGRFDLIVLDPPSFARSRKAVPGALRGYKELALRALQSLPPEGVLATYCCSQNVSASEFEQAVRSAAGDAGRELRLFARTGQPFDHPALINFPESEYLKGLIAQAE